MFYHLNGELCLADATTAVVDCGGVGYQLTISATTANSLSGSIGQKVKLFTHLAVREDGMELFGFRTKEELSCFKLLITVSGVGPKAAMSVLSVLTPDRFSYAVCTEDAKALAKAPGIGAKTAARIVLELKDKISKDTVSGAVSAGSVAATAAAPVSGKLSEAADALSVLGYSRAESLDAIRAVTAGKDLPLEQMITAALKYFATKG